MTIADAVAEDIERFDTVVVGSGLAGCVAACRSQELGSRTLLIDKADEPSCDSNTVLSGGSIHVANVHPLESPERLRARIDEVTDGDAEPGLATALAHNAGRGIAWLSSAGVLFEPVKADATRAVLAPRRLFQDVHAWRDRGPHRTLTLLQRRFAQFGGVLRGSSTLTDIDVEGERIAGISYSRHGETERVSARAVVLADGGFQANAQMLRAYVGPFADQIKLRGAPSGLGDALRLGERAGASPVKLRYFYGHLLHIDSLRNDRLWPAPTLDPLLSQCILVDTTGARMIDEGLGGIAAANRIASSRDPRGSWIVGDARAWRDAEEVAGKLDDLNPRVIPDIEARGGAVHRASDLRELAAMTGVDMAGLQETVRTFNAAHEANRLGALSMPRSGTSRLLSEPAFFAIRCVPGITFTMGGLRIDERARVVDVNGVPISGLLAAGGAAGGLQGSPSGGYVGGLICALVFGLLAGEECAVQAVRALDRDSRHASSNPTRPA